MSTKKSVDCRQTGFRVVYADGDYISLWENRKDVPLPSAASLADALQRIVDKLRTIAAKDATRKEPDHG